MFSAEARVRTDRAGRYLAQLCRHTAQAGALSHDHRPGEGAAMMPRRAEYSGTDGVIEFDRGRCTLRATGDALVLLAEAGDRQDLRLMQDAIAARVHLIGHRDQLTLAWRTGSTAPAQANVNTAPAQADVNTAPGRADLSTA